jgi:SAM-dependent methyltransferase
MNKKSAMSSDQLEQLSQRTLAHYSLRAEEFFVGTVSHDVSQNIAALLKYIAAPAPYLILDVGCGPGRDLKTFHDLGHTAIGLEGCERFAEMARTYSACEVWQQNFLKLNLPSRHFDGVYANASLFHVPSQALPEVLLALHATLKENGVLFSSNPRGNNEEGWNQERYAAYHDLESWRAYMNVAGFTELTHFYRPPGLPIEQQPWLASVWRKV